jgi:hypothetical protein
MGRDRRTGTGPNDQSETTSEEEGERVNRNSIYQDIDDERDRQSQKWSGPHEWGIGDCSSTAVADTVKATVLSEECGEVSRAVLDHDPDQLRTELVQVAAVAVAWLEGM